jgi:hypothetical protein
MHMDQFNFPPSPGCRYAHMRVCVYARLITRTQYQKANDNENAVADALLIMRTQHQNANDSEVSIAVAFN